MLRFRVPDTEGVFFSMEEEGERFLLEYREGILKAVIRFSARPEPVTLAGICRPGNEAVLNFTGFRLELLTEGALADEDWTIGRVDIAGICGRGKGLELRPELGRCLIREEREESFTGIQGWKPEGKNVHLGDCMPFITTEPFTCFIYLIGEDTKANGGLARISGRMLLPRISFTGHSIRWRSALMMRQKGQSVPDRLSFMKGFIMHSMRCGCATALRPS